MPLLEKARIEVYLPDVDQPAYVDFLNCINDELTYTFGGSSVLRGLEGQYLSRVGIVMHDRVNVVYTDTPFEMSAHREKLAVFADELREAALRALGEEAILVVVYPVFHAQ